MVWPETFTSTELDVKLTPRGSSLLSEFDRGHHDLTTSGCRCGRRARISGDEGAHIPQHRIEVVYPAGHTDGGTANFKTAKIGDVRPSDGCLQRNPQHS